MIHNRVPFYGGFADDPDGLVAAARAALATQRPSWAVVRSLDCFRLSVAICSITWMALNRPQAEADV